MIAMQILCCLWNSIPLSWLEWHLYFLQISIVSVCFVPNVQLRITTSQPVSLGQLWLRSVHQCSEDWWFNLWLLQSAHHLALGKILFPKFTLRSSHHCINGYILFISWRDMIVCIQCVLIDMDGILHDYYLNVCVDGWQVFSSTLRSWLAWKLYKCPFTVYLQI